MKTLLIAFAVALASVIATSASAEAPATQPAEEKPHEVIEQVSKATVRPATAATMSPATAPTTQPTLNKFPTPAELIRQMRSKQAEKDKLSKVAYFDLSQPILEAPPGFSLFGDPNATTLRSIIERLNMARDDQAIKGVLVTIGQPTLNLAQAQEIRNALAELGKAGKSTFVYADGYDTIGYTIASGASDVCMLEGGELMIPGVGLEATFAKGLLDKVGVKADYVQVGEFKGADEQLTRAEPTPELRGELNKLVDAMYEQLVDGISLHRNLPREQVSAMIDETILTGRQAKERGFVDHLLDVDRLRELMGKQLDNGVDLVYGYGEPEREEVDLSNPFALFALLGKQPEESTKPAVAVIYAEGVIVDGEGGEGLFGGSGVGSTDLRRAMRSALKDEHVKSIVLRIDSPGGSALASEVMWQATRHVAEQKPLVVSIGGMAASGGYYLASAGDHVFADPSAIVGSIGVVGGKLVLKDLFGKLGINSESFYRGRNADLFSSSEPFTDRQRELVRKWMENTYKQFTDRVMHTRGTKIKDIDKVARGRIFMAKQAKELGMVDELGGIQSAIAYAADKANLEKGEYEVKVLPPPRTLVDLFAPPDPEAAAGPGALAPRVEIAEDSVVRALSPTLRRALGRHLQILQLLQDRPVALVAPYVVTVR